WSTASSDDAHYLLAQGKIHKLNLKAHKVEEIEMESFAFSKNLNEEFKQMFDEVWANLNENYYHENFNGVDWQAVKSRYITYLPYLQSRADLRKLLHDMMGELNTSHYGFTSFGK